MNDEQKESTGRTDNTEGEGYRIERKYNTKSQPVACHFKLLTAGVRKGQYKLMECYSFTSEERREEWIHGVVSALEKRIQEKNRVKALKGQVRADMKHGFQVGQICYNSWGYDQTNVDFYEIIEVKAKSVILQPIGGKVVPGSEGKDSNRVTPDPSRKIDEPQLKLIQFFIRSGESLPYFYLRDSCGSIRIYDKGEEGLIHSWGH